MRFPGGGGHGSYSSIDLAAQLGELLPGRQINVRCLTAARCACLLANLAVPLCQQRCGLFGRKQAGEAEEVLGFIVGC